MGEGADSLEIIAGRILTWDGHPFAAGPAAGRIAAGAVLVVGGRVAALGAAGELAAARPEARVTDLGRTLISPGFVDAHAHYPQTRIVASWGKRLIDWLETYTFPEEARFGDPAYARAVADDYLDLLLAHGTTSVASFCTSHPESVDAFFAAAAARGMRVVAGKTSMDRSAPHTLLDSPERAVAEAETLIGRWHGRGRASYAITPRFAPTSTPEQLCALGELAAAYPGCPIQSHLSEQPDEVAWVDELFPEARDYLDVYDRAELVRPGAIFGHAIHLSDRERERLAEAGASVAHCPTSNTFIGSGLCDVAGLSAAGIQVGLATDIGGGSSFSMLRTMAAAYEVGQLRGHPLHPAHLWWLATAGSAAALGVSDHVGRIEPGMEADLVAIDLASTPAIAQAASRAGNAWDEVFPTIMMGDDRAIRAVWVAGTRV